MPSRLRPTRFLCVNCNTYFNNLRRYPALALDPRVSSILCSWIYPQIILEDDYVSEACRELAMASVNLDRETSNSEEAGPSRRHRTNVCLVCGCSTVLRTSDIILKENSTEIQQAIINMIESKVAPQEITASDCVCHACWLRNKRDIIRFIKNHQDSTRNEEQQDRDVLPSPKPEPVLVLHAQQIVVLPSYRRAANSTHTSVFPSCNSSTLHNISDKLRPSSP